MSREFHWTDACYAHEFLRNTESDRAITGEPVTDSIRDLFIALAPLESAVAGLQQYDTSLEYLLETTIEQAASIKAACIALMTVVDAYTTDEHVMEVLDYMHSAMGRCGSHFFPKIQVFAESQLIREDLSSETIARAQVVRDRSLVAIDVAKHRTGMISAAMIDAEIEMRSTAA